MSGDELNRESILKFGWTLWHCEDIDLAIGSIHLHTTQYGDEPGPPLRILGKATREDWEKWIRFAKTLGAGPRPFSSMQNHIYRVEAAD